MRTTSRLLRGRGPDTRLLAASVVTGVLVGLVVAAFDSLTDRVVLRRVLDQPLGVLMVAPFAGLVLARVLLRYVGWGTSGSTSDEYIRAFHDRNPRLRFREMPGKLLAGVATIGSGGALGLEGPSIYAGSTIGLWVQRRLTSIFGREQARLLLTAGAAAGVAAVFRAPATGVIFALEAPYRDDVTPQALLPSLLASAASYATFVTLVGTDPVIPFLGEGSIAVGAGGDVSVFAVDVTDLLGALLLGLAAGLGGRGFAWLVRRAKQLTTTLSWWTRVAVAGAAMAGLTLVAHAAFAEPLDLGPGTEAMAWVVGDHGLGLVALLFGVRLAATTASILGGGVGGLFIPLAVQGTILGQFVGELLGQTDTGLYPTLGLAAFLGAGYRAPIAAVMFVAESTGGVGAFVVPALVAAAASQIVAGPSSVAQYQRAERLGHLEQRFTLPVTTALTTDVLTVPPDATVSEFVYVHALGRRQTIVPVVDEGRYVGLARLEDIAAVPREEWETTRVGDVAATDVPTARPSWTLRDVLAAMERAHIDLLAVVDDNGDFIGVVVEDEILRLDQILDETGA